jgi:hypothetical protein
MVQQLPAHDGGVVMTQSDFLLTYGWLIGIAVVFVLVGLVNICFPEWCFDRRWTHDHPRVGEKVKLMVGAVGWKAEGVITHVNKNGKYAMVREEDSIHIEYHKVRL